MLAVATAMAVAASVLSSWVHGTVLDTEEFVEVVRPVATSSATSQRISDEASARVTAALDLETRIATALQELTDALPDEVGGLDDLLGGGLGTLLGDGLGDLLGTGSLGDLLDPDAAATVAPRVAEDLEARVVVAVEAAVDTPEFRDELVRAVEASHVDLVDVVRDDDGGAAADLVVDLEPLLRTAAEQAAADLDGLPGQLAQQAVTTLEVPEEETRLVLVQAEQFAPHRANLALLDRGTWAFVTISLLLTAGIVLAARRWWGVVAAGVAVVAGAVLAGWLADDRARGVLDAVTDPAGRATAGDVLDALVVPLDGLVSTVQLGGLVVAGIGLVGVVVARILGRRDPDAPGARGRS